MKNRKGFYKLKRESDESIQERLRRVQGHMEKFKYALVYKFIGELNIHQIKMIRSVDVWSLNKLHEYFDSQILVQLNDANMMANLT